MDVLALQRMLRRKWKTPEYLKQSSDDGAFLPYYISFPLVLLSHFF